MVGDVTETGSDLEVKLFSLWPPGFVQTHPVLHVVSCDTWHLKSSELWQWELSLWQRGGGTSWQRGAYTWNSSVQSRREWSFLENEGLSLCPSSCLSLGIFLEISLKHSAVFLNCSCCSLLGFVSLLAHRHDQGITLECRASSRRCYTWPGTCTLWPQVSCGCCWLPSLTKHLSLPSGATTRLWQPASVTAGWRCL